MEIISLFIVCFVLFVIRELYEQKKQRDFLRDWNLDRHNIWNKYTEILEKIAKKANATDTEKFKRSFFRTFEEVFLDDRINWQSLYWDSTQEDNAQRHPKYRRIYDEIVSIRLPLRTPKGFFCKYNQSIPLCFINRVYTNEILAWFLDNITDENQFFDYSTGDHWSPHMNDFLLTDSNKIPEINNSIQNIIALSHTGPKIGMSASDVLLLWGEGYEKGKVKVQKTFEEFTLTWWGTRDGRRVIHKRCWLRTTKTKEMHLHKYEIHPVDA